VLTLKDYKKDELLAIYKETYGISEQESNEA